MSQKPSIVILTNNFPNNLSYLENWLIDEMAITSQNYNQIFIYPSFLSGKYHDVSTNTHIKNYNTSSPLTFSEKWFCLQVVFTDYKRYPSKKDFFRQFKYNFSLIKQSYQKSKQVVSDIKNTSNNIIIYAYWADNLATIACFVRRQISSCKVVTRAHGFEIFEDQTHFNVVPFRTTHYKFVDRIFTDSKRGLDHLNLVNANYINKNALSYVGTKDLGMGNFEVSNQFTLVSCANLTELKRVHLMPKILEHISFDITWYILGDGEMMNELKDSVSKLPKHCNVVFKGLMNNSDILHFYKETSLNLFVSLSRSEGLPVSMMEALSFGIPIMSTNVGGCSEICNDRTGFLIEKEFNASEVAKKITEFKNSSKNTMQFHLQCRQIWIDNFNAEKNYSAFSKQIIEL